MHLYLCDSMVSQTDLRVVALYHLRAVVAQNYLSVVVSLVSLVLKCLSQFQVRQFELVQVLIALFVPPTRTCPIITEAGSLSSRT